MEIVLGVTALLLTSLGIYGIVTTRHLIRLVLCFNILEAAVLLALVLVGYRAGAVSPIVREESVEYVIALPHALALTAIVIGASLTALMLAFIVRIYRATGSVSVEALREWRR